MFVVAVVLGILGLCLGSFVNALTWRLRNKKDWVNGRSQCPKCSHQLAAQDLIPVVSWLLLKGRCRYCKKPISKQYPLVEIIVAANFIASYYCWPGSLSSHGAKFALASWLAVSVGLTALAVYDWRWRLLPNKLIYPTAALAILLRLIYILAFTSDKLNQLGQWGVAVLVASGLFWVLYTVSAGAWIGYGDVRLGLITGSVLATPGKSILMIFGGSLLGSLAALPGLLSKRRELNSVVAFGPFLILATALSVLFGDSLIHWYRHLL